MPPRPFVLSSRLGDSGFALDWRGRSYSMFAEPIRSYPAGKRQAVERAWALASARWSGSALATVHSYWSAVSWQQSSARVTALRLASEWRGLVAESPYSLAYPLRY